MTDKNEFVIKQIAHIENGFREKFGIPRQSGLAEAVISKIVFEEDYRNADMVRGLENFDYIWVIWQFSSNTEAGWSPTVRPPILGGNERMGVFATRSPFRPNSLGLSSVKLEKLEMTKESGPVLYVSGADMKNGTPIFDIKPYVPYADSHENAAGGFTDTAKKRLLKVEMSEEMAACLKKDDIEAVKEIISQDPRPAYHDDPERVYGLSYKEYGIRFKVGGDTAEIIEIKHETDL